MNVYFNEVGLDLFYPSQEPVESSSKECAEISIFTK
jgi:hypothetical protein